MDLWQMMELIINRMAVDVGGENKKYALYLRGCSRKDYEVIHK